MYIWHHDICHATASRWCHICQNVSLIPSNRYDEAIFAFLRKSYREKHQGVVPTPNGRPRVKAHSWSWVNKLIYFFSDCSWPGSKRVSTSWCRTNPDGSCWPTDRVVFYEGLDTANSGRGGKTIWCNFHEIFAKFIAHFFALFNLNNGRFFLLLSDLSNDIITKSWAAVSRSK